MTITGSMLTGVSGLIADSAQLGAISKNISNLNTMGYKRESVNFNDFVAGDGTSPTAASSVLPVLQQFVSQAGSVQTTSSPTDLAIVGTGMFVTTRSPTPTATDTRLYTRAGSFTPDANGYLKNAAGLYLQGWPVMSDGSVVANATDVTQLQTVQLRASGNASPTTTVAISANLNAGAAIATPPDKPFDIPVTVYDTLGTAQTLTVEFTQTAANTWNATVFADAAKTKTVTTLTGLQFDANTGLIKPPANAPFPLTLNYSANGASSTQAVTLDLSTLTQFSSPSAVVSTAANGTLFGQLASVTVNDQGFVIASYKNGGTRKIYQLALANFPNPDGLQPTSDDAYLVTPQSGVQALHAPESGGAGKITAQALETSNVDLSTELTNMITTQRAYSACSKIITTADQMLQELVDIKR